MTQLGVIGGLGPMATAYFMQLVIQLTDAETDQQHIPMTVLSRPATPDRTAFILGKSKESPLPSLLEAGRLLEQIGVSHIAIPCITAHCFHSRLEQALSVPVIHAVRETALELRAMQVSSAGIMATEGTVMSGVFQRELEAAGIRAVLPGERGQSLVTETIFGRVKASLPADMEIFREAEDDLRGRGAQMVILGCTELSVVKRDNDLGGGFIDALEVLAKRSVTLCGGRVKGQTN